VKRPSGPVGVLEALRWLILAQEEALEEGDSSALVATLRESSALLAHHARVRPDPGTAAPSSREWEELLERSRHVEARIRRLRGELLRGLRPGAGAVNEAYTRRAGPPGQLSPDREIDLRL